MTSDPLDAGSLLIRRTDLGLPGTVALFKFLASIIVLSKKHRVLAAARQGVHEGWRVCTRSSGATAQFPNPRRCSDRKAHLPALTTRRVYS